MGKDSKKELIKEFLYHSLDTKTLDAINDTFEKHKSNINTEGDPIIMFAEIKLLGGTPFHLSEKHLSRLKTDGFSFLFRNYRGNNYTEIIHYPND